MKCRSSSNLGFVLVKYKSNEPAVLAQIPHKLVDSQATHSINIDHFTKVLGMEWNATFVTFQPVVSSLKHVKMLTKWALLWDITRLSDVLSWCSPAIIKPKILLRKCGGRNVIGITLLPNPSLQCGNDSIQNFMFYGSIIYHESISKGLWRCIYRIAWILWCIGIGLCWGNVY